MDSLHRKDILKYSSRNEPDHREKREEESVSWRRLLTMDLVRTVSCV